MNHFLISLSFLLLPTAGFTQSVISGKVTDPAGGPVTGANAYLQGTYDGAASDSSGTFSFATNEKGIQTLVVSCIGYEFGQILFNIDTLNHPVRIVLNPVATQIAEVTITAGVFSAGDQRRSSVLKPLDIATTAGATADITGVMNTLPGTQTVAENGRLYVRGGDSRETSAFIDGLWVAEPFSVAPANTPSRFRFSPFLFKGTFFSTGGYSAEYGQALSSILVLNTSDLPQRSQTDIGLMSVGCDVSQTFRFNKSSIFAQASYTDLGLYFKMVPQRYPYEIAPRGYSGTLHYKLEASENTHLKWYGSFQTSKLKLQQPSLNDVYVPAHIRLNDRLAYSNLSFQTLTNSGWLFRGGLGYGNRFVKAGYNQSENEAHSVNWQAKIVADKPLNDRMDLKLGAEVFNNICTDAYFSSAGTVHFPLSNYLTVSFSELEINLNKKLAARPGIRLEYTSLNRKLQWQPRFSLAYRTGDKSQLSFALGKFTQLPDNQFFRLNNQLESEIAFHYLLNYQLTPSAGQTFRFELYHKKYNNLIRYENFDAVSAVNMNNSGDGYASGIELFWRDDQTISGLDYWISYSYLNSKRRYLDYPSEAAPHFAPAHSFSAVGKYFVRSIRTQIGATYQFGSGRVYDDPNTEAFNDRKMKAYHNMSLNFSYLLKQNIIIHGSVSNAPGFNHDFGRQYSAQPNDNGFYESIPVEAEAKRFIFIGCFITLSKEKNANQLNNL